MRRIFLLAIYFISILACSKDNEEQAIDSLIGEWDITEIYYQAGNRVELGLRPDTSFTIIETDGFFNFNSTSSVTFNYSVNGTDYSGENDNWLLESESRKNGFTNSEAYFIIINYITYEVQFGDGTSDSHENALEARILFIDNLGEVGPYEAHAIAIKKL